jgi:hypothetical protein
VFDAAVLSRVGKKKLAQRERERGGRSFSKLGKGNIDSRAMKVIGYLNGLPRPEQVIVFPARF